MTSDYGKALDGLAENRQRRISGNYNCIPWGISRLERTIPGLEQRHYYVVTANTGVGKTALTDALFFYKPFEFARAYKSVNMKGLYFSLEISKEKKLLQAASRKLWLDSPKDNRLRVVLKQMESKQGILDAQVLETLRSEEYQAYFKDLQDAWTIVTQYRTTKQILDLIIRFCESRGSWEYRDNPITGKKEKYKFVLKDKYEYNIIIVDHVSLIKATAADGYNKRIAIETLSKEFVRIRNTYGCTLVAVQQQAKAKSSNESFKLGRLEPSAEGLSDCKTTIDDCETAFGLFSAAEHELDYYPNRQGYKVSDFGDSLRHLNIIKAREGGVNNVYPLFFDGGVKIFYDMPKPTAGSKLELILNYIKRIP